MTKQNGVVINLISMQLIKNNTFFYKAQYSKTTILFFVNKLHMAYWKYVLSTGNFQCVDHKYPEYHCQTPP